jgi:hypothetical protein
MRSLEQQTTAHEVNQTTQDARQREGAPKLSAESPPTENARHSHKPAATPAHKHHTIIVSKSRKTERRNDTRNAQEDSSSELANKGSNKREGLLGKALHQEKQRRTERG